jgi:hypothetical protein
MAKLLVHIELSTVIHHDFDQDMVPNSNGRKSQGPLIKDNLRVNDEAPENEDITSIRFGNLKSSQLQSLGDREQQDIIINIPGDQPDFSDNNADAESRPVSLLNRQEQQGGLSMDRPEEFYWRRI